MKHKLETLWKAEGRHLGTGVRRGSVKTQMVADFKAEKRMVCQNPLVFSMTKKQYDYRNRVYSTDLGRFLQTDPIRFNAGLPATLRVAMREGDVNLYRYVGNDVTYWRDPNGLWHSNPGGWIGGALGGAAGAAAGAAIGAGIGWNRGGKAGAAAGALAGGIVGGELGGAAGEEWGSDAWDAMVDAWDDGFGDVDVEDDCD